MVWKPQDIYRERSRLRHRQSDQGRDGVSGRREAAHTAVALGRRRAANTHNTVSSRGGPHQQAMLQATTGRAAAQIAAEASTDTKRSSCVPVLTRAPAAR